MPHNEREQFILEYLQKNREATVAELCRALFVSEPTMRRDLAALNSAGKIIRTHGGAAHRSALGKICRNPSASASIPRQSSKSEKSAFL